MMAWGSFQPSQEGLTLPASWLDCGQGPLGLGSTEQELGIGGGDLHALFVHGCCVTGLKQT